MNIAKISTKGQVTLPIEVRRKLNLNEGDHLLITEENGRYYIDNAERVQNILSRHAFASTTEEVETKLDEADRQAAEVQTRYSADEVFERVKRNIRAGV
jgi:AbrB family looped-hinge helix DNA binding protein